MRVTAQIYTLSLHDALPISNSDPRKCVWVAWRSSTRGMHQVAGGLDRKSTRLNSSHRTISYAVFCLKKKKTYTENEFNNGIRLTHSCSTSFAHATGVKFASC